MKTTNFYPFVSIEKRMDGNNYMVFFPKFYTQSSSYTNPKTGLKTITRYVAKEKLNGFHCHPAFMVDGEETETGILISSYYWSGDLTSPQSTPTGSALSKTFPEFKTALEENPSYHLMNLYEWSMIQLLLLLEAQGTEITYNLSGDKSSMLNSPAYHYYMSDITGRMNIFFVDGFRVDSAGKFVIFKNDGSGEEVETGVAANTTSGQWYPVDLLDDEGEGFDFKDLFVARTKSSDIGSGSFYTEQYFEANKIVMPRGGYALGLTVNPTTYKSWARFVKYV